MSGLKVVLVVPNYSFEDIYPDYQVSLPLFDSIKLVPGATHPLGISYIASVLKKRGHSVEFIDGVFEDRKSLIDKIQGENPDIVGIQSVSPLWDRVVSLSRDLKDIFGSDVLVGVGGSHVNTVGGSCIEEHSCIDFAAVGDGDVIIPDLCDFITTEHEKNVSEVGELDVGGIVYRNDEGELVYNDPVPRFVEDLDTLPFPDREIIDLDDYCPSIGFYRDRPSTNMVTTRGCMMSCNFCHSSDLPLRKRSIDDVIEELREIEKMDVKDILIYDQDFGADVERAKKICKKIIEEGFDFYIGCNLRINSFDQELIELMKKAGFWRVFYGIESGVQKNLDRVNKGTTLENIRRVVEKTDEAGIQVFGSFILGIPGETFEEGLKTIEFAKNLPLSFAKFVPYSPWPGNDVYENPQKYGHLEKGFEKMSMNRVNFVPHSMEKGDVETLLRKGFKEFYIRPTYIWRRIKSIRTFEDFKQNIRGFVSFIRS